MPEITVPTFSCHDLREVSRVSKKIKAKKSKPKYLSRVFGINLLIWLDSTKFSTVILVQISIPASKTVATFMLVVANCSQ